MNALSQAAAANLVAGAAVGVFSIVSNEYMGLSNQSSGLVQSALDSAISGTNYLAGSNANIALYSDTSSMLSQLSSDLGNASLWPA